MASTTLPEGPEQDAALKPFKRKTWRVGTLSYTAVGLVALFCWLLVGDFAWSMRERSVTPMVQLLMKRFNASDLIMGLLIGALPQAMWILVGPLVGYHSDRHRSRWGRRIPFLLIPTPIAVLGMLGLGFSPSLGHALHVTTGGAFGTEANAVLCVLGLSWTLFEFAAIIANSVFICLINDVVPKELLGRFYGAFRAMSLIAGMVFNYWIIGHAEVHYTLFFCGIAGVYGLGFTLMCLKVKEGTYPPPQLEVKVGLLRGIRDYCRMCFAHSYYRWVFAAIALPTTAFVPVTLFSLPFAKELGLGMDQFGKYIALTFLISLGLAYFLGVLADKFHPIKLNLVVLVAFAAAMVVSGFYVRTPTLFGIALVAQGVLAGTWGTVTASLAHRLFPQQEFAQFWSALNVVMHVCMVLVAPLTGKFLDHTDHNYRYAYFVSFGLTVAAIIAGIVLYRKFRALGGTENYIAPEYAK